MLELHVWGSANQISGFCAESIAATIYFKLATSRSQSKTDHRIVPSVDAGYLDNVCYGLPFLKDTTNDGKVVEGYENIVRYLKKLNIEYDLDAWLSNNNALLNTACSNFISQKLFLISYYNYFLNKSNYDKFTIKLFRFYLPFPLQYYVPVRLKERLLQKCEVIGLSSTSSNNSYYKTSKEQQQNEEFAKEKMERIEKELSLPSLGSVHSDLQKKRLESLQLLKDTSGNFRGLNLLQQYIERIDINDTIIPQADEANSSSTYIFGDQPSSSDILLIGFIISSCNEALPDQFLNSLLQLKYPKIAHLAKDFKDKYVFY
ncbi:SAM complex subunit [Saccharomycopsis crataegensis]|uniref:SAM complex subunit n=1 Tax=Saccharomycopsis crataegensis TaxID=43959 RepID=A0AAV5QGM6_9ASCO|nr:SAM complex subunit [Saccharomycopsis crataegensis]